MPCYVGSQHSSLKKHTQKCLSVLVTNWGKDFKGFLVLPLLPQRKILFVAFTPHSVADLPVFHFIPYLYAHLFLDMRTNAVKLLQALAAKPRMRRQHVAAGVSQWYTCNNSVSRECGVRRLSTCIYELLEARGNAIPVAVSRLRCYFMYTTGSRQWLHAAAAFAA
jgi:hypothetical protein